MALLEPLSEQEAADLEKAIKASGCECGKTVAGTDRAGLAGWTIPRCALHRELADNPDVLSRLLGRRRMRDQLVTEEYVLVDYPTMED